MREDAERLARERLTGPDPEGHACEVTSALKGVDPGLLAGLAGRVLGRGFVDIGEAAAELLEETLAPYLDDLRRRVRLGLPEVAAAIGHGLLLGVARVSASRPGRTAGASNGPTEAMNLLIGEICRVGHGYRNARNYRLRHRLHCGTD